MVWHLTSSQGGLAMPIQHDLAGLVEDTFGQLKIY